MSQDGQGQRPAWLKARATMDNPVSRPACSHNARTADASHIVRSAVSSSGPSAQATSPPLKTRISVSARAVRQTAPSRIQRRKGTNRIASLHGDLLHVVISLVAACCRWVAWASRWALRAPFPLAGWAALVLPRPSSFVSAQLHNHSHPHPYTHTHIQAQWHLSRPTS